MSILNRYYIQFKIHFFYLFIFLHVHLISKKNLKDFFQFESFKENMRMFLCDGILLNLDLILSGIYLLIRWTKKCHFLFFYQWSLYVNWPYIHSVCCNLKLVDFANHESVLYILVTFTFNYKIQEKLTQFFHYFNIIFISSLDRNFGHLWPKENKYMIQVYHKTCETINCKIS